MAKLLLFPVAIEVGYTWLAVVAAVNTVISIFYYVRVPAPAYFGGAETPASVLGRSAGWAAIGSAAAVLVTGLLAKPFMTATQDSRAAHPLTRGWITSLTGAGALARPAGAC